ncbi:MAG: alkaline phosphatase D family protein [Planctomycetota bacterium]
MKRRPFLSSLGAALLVGHQASAAKSVRRDRVSLRDAHKGTLEIDTRLLDSYGPPTRDRRQFYLEARACFAENADADFTHPQILAAAQRNGIALMGGPMLGDVSEHGVTIWLRPATEQDISLSVEGKTIPIKDTVPGKVTQHRIDGLQPNRSYSYAISVGKTPVAEGTFRTAPEKDARDVFRLAFGSCCHKIGVHNANLFGTVVDRQPHAMMLLGDIAVDDRNNEVNMHRADYQLRDTSVAWQHLVGHVPVFASWDDHDYFDNDRSGIPRRYTAADRDAVRSVWHENWNNPRTPDSAEGIYFRSRLGPVEVIMLDTRSCRDNTRRNQYGSYLGDAQLEWLKQSLQSSTAPFKVISSGTMWSDYVSKAKDSWGTWDKQAREEIFALIEKEQIGGVLLVSGDRHGARGFRIPRPSGFSFHEFEPATLGGVSGPKGRVDGCDDQLFGYDGSDADGEDFIAFGEFTFDTRQNEPVVTFRLVGQHGDIHEEHHFTLAQLTPPSA